MAFYSGAEVAGRELHHFVFVHQSEVEGVESLPRLIMPDHGLLMPAVGAHTWNALHLPEAPELRPAEGLRLVPFADEVQGSNLVTMRAQTLASGLAAQWKAQLRARVPDIVPGRINPLVVVTFTGRGSSLLRELDKHDHRTDPLNNDTLYAGAPDEAYRTMTAPGGHYRTAIDDVRQVAAWAAANGLVYRLVFVGLLQGLSNESLRIVREASADVIIDGNAETQPLSEAAFEGYHAADVEKLLSDFVADTAPYRGAFAPPPLLIMVPNVYHVGEAIRQAAAANDNIHIVGPTYHLPTAINSEWTANGIRHGAPPHLAPDSQNVVGEMFGKAAGAILFGEASGALSIKHAWMGGDDATVFVRLNVEHPPAQINTRFLAKAPGWGFEVAEADLTGGIEPRAVSVAGDDLLELTFAADLPAENRRLRVGWNSDVAALSPVKAVNAAAPAFANGAAATEITLTGDVTSKVAKLMEEGAFMLCAQGASRRSLQNVNFSVPVRGHSVVDGDSVLRVETAELATSGETFTAGEVPFCGRARGYTNVCDSDPTRSVYRWSDRMPAKRAGKHYPLHNWLMLTDRITILEDEPA